MEARPVVAQKARKIRRSPSPRIVRCPVCSERLRFTDDDDPDVVIGEHSRFVHKRAPR